VFDKGVKDMTTIDFISLIDGRLASMMKYPIMFGTNSEIELGVHLLLGLRCEILGHGGEEFQKMRGEFCLEHKVRSKLSFATQFKDTPEKFTEVLSDYIFFCVACCVKLPTEEIAE
jgi:hypothetical protein